MPRKNTYGKFIFSAGEIATYSVCPESWRLMVMEGKKQKKNQHMKSGSALHDSWASEYFESVVLIKGIRITLLLIVLASIISVTRFLP